MTIIEFWMHSPKSWWKAHPAREAQKAERELDEGDGEEDAGDRRKLMAQDEFRDGCKRGSGNRYNRS